MYHSMEFLDSEFESFGFGDCKREPHHSCTPSEAAQSV